MLRTCSWAKLSSTNLILWVLKRSCSLMIAGLKIKNRMVVWGEILMHEHVKENLEGRWSFSWAPQQLQPFSNHKKTLINTGNRAFAKSYLSPCEGLSKTFLLQYSVEYRLFILLIAQLEGCCRFLFLLSNER